MWSYTQLVSRLGLDNGKEYEDYTLVLDVHEIASRQRFQTGRIGFFVVIWEVEIPVYKICFLSRYDWILWE